jgi:hypothetical protein
MAILKDISNSIFGWISPQTKHGTRDAKASSTSHDPHSVTAITMAKRKARAASKQTDTKIVPYHRRSQNSGAIVWEDAPPSSPTIYRSIEDQLAATGLTDDEMDDAGDEGAIDTLSGEDDSGLLGEDEDEDGASEEGDYSESITKLAFPRLDAEDSEQFLCPLSKAK